MAKPCTSISGEIDCYFAKLKLTKKEEGREEVGLPKNDFLKRSHLVLSHRQDLCVSEGTKSTKKACGEKLCFHLLND